MTDIKHEITLDCQGCEKVSPEELIVTCSCGETVWEHPFPVQYSDLAIVLNEHLKEQNMAVMKEIMTHISVKDILGVLRGMKK